MLWGALGSYRVLQGSIGFLRVLTVDAEAEVGAGRPLGVSALDPVGAGVPPGDVGDGQAPPLQQAVAGGPRCGAGSGVRGHGPHPRDPPEAAGGHRALPVPPSNPADPSQ